MNQREQIKEAVLAELDFSKEIEDTEIHNIIDHAIIKSSKEYYMPIQERYRLSKELFFDIRRLGILQELIEDDSITEIMVNGVENIFVERNGKVEQWDQNFQSREKLLDVIQQIVAECNRVVNESSPIVDARLSNGDRVNVILPPVALNGPILTIRRFANTAITMEKLIQWKSLTKEMAGFLSELVKAKYNIFISGGTGSGKTTFLNALTAFIPQDERIITIEDSAELQLQGIPNLVRLETRNANVEGCVPITIRDLIKASLRQRPDRIVIGEVRGAECIDLLSAMNTGHDGSLSTGHANSAQDMLSRLETMVLMGMDIPMAAIEKQIASAIDIFVHLGRLKDKSRKVLEISEVLGYEQGEIRLNPIYRFVEEDKKEGKLGTWKKLDNLNHQEKLRSAGL
ncbi:MAG: CpaF family protein [Lachnospiraceae bacterium]|nr:CpaF family protein [Lachnospiraceae bacterium]